LTKLEVCDHNNYVTKKIAVWIGLFFFVLFILTLLFAVQPALARHRRVLGISTQSATPQIPPTVEGPGLILPDSPFFFLDRIKQAIRLFFAFNPQDKAKIHNAVAGERLAELRVMLAKQNQNGIETALDGVSKNMIQAAENLTNAQLKGENIAETARKINLDIKRRQELLDVLENQTEGRLRFLVSAAQSSILQSKIKVEDGLPDDEFEIEVRDDLNREIEKRIEDATESALKLEDNLDKLEEEATEAAQKALKRREEALKKAIEEKNEARKKTQEKLLELEKKKQEKLLEAQKKANEKAKEAIEKAKEAAKRFEEAQKKVNEIHQEASNSGSSENSGAFSNSNSSSNSNSFSGGNKESEED